jgi:pyridoxal phosphate enzyme (YggS family)
MTKEEFKSRLDILRERMEKACIAAGRSPESVKLLPVSKNHPVETLRIAIDAGIESFGENRVQEALTKIEVLEGQGIQWHLIGHLQSNKAARAVKVFDLIQSLDRPKLARLMDRYAGELKKKIPVFIQVNVSGEVSKFGVSPEQFEELRDLTASLPNLRLMGLMTIGLLSEDMVKVGKGFKLLRKLGEDTASRGFFDTEEWELSMGMTSDFEVAIREGATMIRIGTALFGERRY